MRHSISSFAISATATLFLAACGGSSGGGGSDSGSSTTGTASFSATDAPVDDVTRVRVTFDAIAIKPQDGPIERVDFDTPVTIENLLDLTGDSSELILGKTTFPAGQYDFIRLFVTGGSPDSEVEENGGAVLDLFIPGQQPQAQNNNDRFLQLVTPFVIPAGGNADFTIDFELRKALTKPNGLNHYLLRPALRLVNNVETDSITGTVADTLVMDPSCKNDLTADEGNDVYLYNGFDADVGDVNLDSQGNPDHDSDDTDLFSPETNPLMTAEVKQNQETGVYEYTIGFVAEGEYTIAFNCQGLTETVEGDEALDFVQSQDVTVDADNDPEVVDFTAPSGV